MPPAIVPVHQFGNSSCRPFAGIGFQSSSLDPPKCDRYGTMVPQKCVYHHRKKFDQNEALFAHDVQDIQARLQGGVVVGIIPRRLTDRIVSWCTIRMDLVAIVSLVDMKRVPNKFVLPQYEIVYSLDCELVHTMNGLEVARVSLVDTKGRAILDTCVLPQ
ncbi:Protein CBG27487 [Caenorhabditis briggsae]|uniref:Uncharacterized protein n=2 Tax=Caenorhabditis briggsae TaxID=6238 RepID=A0AAE8ZPN2_CAEBR|nr:Protein CBG27487 [Caenorhabditis briggsae]ULT80513.1 hypothetical protein L3Y34_010818 [Caenorhabditis briggsae]CAR98482.1 Protein CBG27487 [Caenorhabditis briggsae]